MLIGVCKLKVLMQNIEIDGFEIAQILQADMFINFMHALADGTEFDDRTVIGNEARIGCAACGAFLRCISCGFIRSFGDNGGQAVFSGQKAFAADRDIQLIGDICCG